MKKLEKMHPELSDLKIIAQKLLENIPVELAFDAKEKFGIELEVHWNDETNKWKVSKKHDGRKAALLFEEKQFINGWLQGYQVAIVAMSALSEVV